MESGFPFRARSRTRSSFLLFHQALGDHQPQSRSFNLCAAGPLDLSQSSENKTLTGQGSVGAKHGWEWRNLGTEN